MIKYYKRDLHFYKANKETGLCSHVNMAINLINILNWDEFLYATVKAEETDECSFTEAQMAVMDIINEF